MILVCMRLDTYNKIAYLSNFIVLDLRVVTHMTITYNLITYLSQIQHTTYVYIIDLINFLGLAVAISRGPARHRAMQCGGGVGRHS